MVNMRSFHKFEETNLTFLAQKSIEFTLVQITATGYKKSILDATEPMRLYFKKSGFHNYETQLQGQTSKVIQKTIILDDTSSIETTTSLYRPETKKGDPRIWTSKLTRFCKPDDIFAMIYYSNCLYVINITQVNLSRVYSSSIITPLKDMITRISNKALCISHELFEKISDLSTEWHPADVLADTGVGRAIEKLLGIDMNNSKLPDYKGIELKSYRDKRPNVRSTLFCQVPDWSISNCKSAKDIVSKYGYIRYGFLTYQNTLNCLKPNSQNLSLTLYQLKKLLAIEEKNSNADANGNMLYTKLNDVALWKLTKLHDRLLEKHHETFWIEVETQNVHGREMFKPTLIDHTKNPIVSQFDSLLDTGYITVDLLLSRPSGRGDTIAFKIKKKAKPMLFPDTERIVL